MIEINNTAEMAEYLARSEADVVRFPANVNLLLNDGYVSNDASEELTIIGRAAGRSVHQR